MAMEIGSERVQEADDKYQVVSEICNGGNSDATVRVTQHPFDKDGKKIGEKQETQVTIPAHRCLSVVFEFPGDRKPHKSYTDVYDSAGNLLDGEINSLQPEKAGAGDVGVGGARPATTAGATS